MRIKSPRSVCRFGVARCEITPPVGIYHRMWGAAVHDRSEGVHRPLTTTAMVFQQTQQPQAASTQQVLLAIDHCLLGVKEVDSILNAVAQKTGLALEETVITFSHTHAAGLLNLDRVDLPGGHLIPAYLEQLGKQAATLVSTALGQAREATIEYAVGSCRLAAHRDYFDQQHGEWVCGYNPDGPTDDTVLVARVTDADGNLIATCVNYACHPTTLAWDNRLISPDYPGAMREVIEQATHVPCVFLQGASGDLGPVDGYVGDVAVADRNGRQLGHAALSALESLPAPRTAREYAGPVVSGATIGSWQHSAISAAEIREGSAWSLNRAAVPLAYREDLPTAAQAESTWKQLTEQEEVARREGNEVAARELRALAERQKRIMGRLQSLPNGNTFPYQAVTWRMGNAIWIALPGEPYHLLQRRLRERFPGTPIIIATIANGWGPSYLPTEETYGKGIYQESIAALAPGCLETLIDALTTRIEELTRTIKP